MIERKSNIALFLGILFVFPLFFQPVHIIIHKNKINKSHKHSFHCCNLDKTDSKISFQEAKEKCPIGDYEFSLTILNTFLKNKVIDLNVYISNHLSLPSIIIITRSLIQLRAPPVSKVS